MKIEGCFYEKTKRIKRNTKFIFSRKKAGRVESSKNEIREKHFNTIISDYYLENLLLREIVFKLNFGLNTKR